MWISPTQPGKALDISLPHASLPHRQTSHSTSVMPLRTRRLKNCAILLPQLLAIGVFLAPGTARADQLCGRQFDSLSQLYADLRSEAAPAWRVIERPTHVIFAGGQRIWAFARDTQPSFPAVACLQIVEVDNQIETIVQVRCEGAKDACDAVTAKAKGKDWSNLFGG
jgi:hypothetical protein